MKIALIRPPQINRVWVGIPRFFNNDIFLFPPLGIMQLKSFVEQRSRHQALIYDSLMHNADYKKVALFIKENSIRVAGISTFTHSLIDVVKTAKAIKEANPQTFVLLGGPHTYSFTRGCQYLLNSADIDAIILGDGEKSLLSLLDALENKASLAHIPGLLYTGQDQEPAQATRPAYIEDLDSLPHPARKIYKIKDYYTPASHGQAMTTMITSRGCPYGCKFCNVQKQYRCRSVKNVVEEMGYCASLGFREIFFIDDTFNISTERVIQLAQQILNSGLKIKWGAKVRCDNVNKEMLKIAQRAGCIRLHYGVETGINEGLNSLAKKINLAKIRETFQLTKQAKIRSVAYFILGCPHEKEKSDIISTINFACSLPADFAVFSLLSPYPDALFYSEGVEKGLINPNPWEQFLNTPQDADSLPTAWEEHFSKDQLWGLLKSAHRRFYYRPRIIARALGNIHSFRELKRIISGGISLAKLELAQKTKDTI